MIYGLVGRSSNKDSFLLGVSERPNCNQPKPLQVEARATQIGMKTKYGGLLLAILTGCAIAVGLGSVGPKKMMTSAVVIGADIGNLSTMEGTAGGIADIVAIVENDTASAPEVSVTTAMIDDYSNMTNIGYDYGKEEPAIAGAEIAVVNADDIACFVKEGTPSAGSFYAVS